MTKEDYAYRRSAVIIPMIFCFLLSIWFFYNSFKTLNSVGNTTGIIVEKGIAKEKYHGNNIRYTFYLRVDSKNQYFGIFLGSGDNAIKEGKYYTDLFEYGQPVTIYYDNNIITTSENITRLIYRLDYKGETIIETNQTGRRIAGLISLTIALSFLWMRHFIKKKYIRQLAEAY